MHFGTSGIDFDRCQHFGRQFGGTFLDLTSKRIINIVRYQVHSLTCKLRDGSVGRCNLLLDASFNGSVLYDPGPTHPGVLVR